MEEEQRSSVLTPEELGPDPIQAFARWYDEAQARSRLSFPNAACLSTVDPGGWPEGRIVLLKGVDGEGFRFFTNFRSTKGRSLEETPRAALTFYWDDLDRQVRVQGAVERLPEEEADAYFATRPRGSQIGAWASDQSAPLESREELVRRFAEFEERFADGDVPRPPFWGGYLVRPGQIEFWQAGEDRLHDRIRFTRKGADEWRVERLSP